MSVSGGNVRLVFWIAVIPALLSVGVLILAVREPARTALPKSARSPIHPSELKRLGPAYWRLVAIGTVLTLARFSEAFLILRVQDLGLAATLVPLVLVVMNVVYGLAAYPVGAISDRKDPKVLLCAGFGVLIAADLVLAAGANPWVGMFGVALWGLHMGMTQGLLASLVAAAVPGDRRGNVLLARDVAEARAVARMGIAEARQMRLRHVADMQPGAVLDQQVRDRASDAGGTGGDEPAQAGGQGYAGHGRVLGVARITRPFRAE